MLHETLEYLGIAFISSVLLIIMSKIILQALIRRPADYYDARELRDEELMLNAAGISITSEHETNPEGVPIEDTHLEAHLGEIVPATPEEIITEIPDAVHESIEIIEHDEEEEEPSETIFEEPDEVVEIAETEDFIDLPEEEPEAEVETEAVPEPVEEEPEPEAEAETDAVPEPTEEEMEPEPETEAPPSEPEPETDAAPEEPAEPDYTFSIKAKTSRTKKHKKKEDEERELEAEAERAEAERAIREAAEAAAQSDSLPEWTESYADIRESLEQAFTDKTSKVRKPSMRMNKQELTEHAVSLGIDVPAGATKRQILDLIYEVMEEGSDADN